MSVSAAPPSLVRPAARRRRVRAGGYLLLAPSLLLLGLFTYWPVVQVAWRSAIVQRFGAQRAPGAGNFVRLLHDPHFAKAAANTAIYAAGTILPSLVLALAFALGLQRTTWLNQALRTVLVLPMLIPLVAAAALFTFIFLPGAGLLDHGLARLGLAETNWLGDPDLALGAIMAITVWKNAGYYMLFFLAGLAGVSQDLLDAAKLDGARAWARFRHVTLPLLGPSIGFVTVIAILNVLTQVDHVIVMTQGGPSDSTNMLLYYIYQQAQQNNDVGLAAAATVVSVAVLFALATVSLRTLERGIHYES